jgi:superfamily II DNA or RNA helicase
MRQSEMLSTFFVHDGGSTQDWRLKGHARSDFWKWVCSWGAIVKMPSDVGGSDDGYVLPELRYHEHIVPASQDDARKSGLLFAEPAATMADERAARRGTIDSRVALTAGVANATDEQVIVWCGLNTESEALTEAIRGSVEVTGSQDDDEKERNIERFLKRDARVLVSKASICGFGLNLQQVNTVAFCGVSHSFEQFYQAVRRCWRFGQERPVDVHIVSSELEGRVVANLKEKQRKAEELAEETRHHVAAYVRSAVGARARDTIEYAPRLAVRWPEWLTSEVA